MFIRKNFVLIDYDIHLMEMVCYGGPPVEIDYYCDIYWDQKDDTLWAIADGFKRRVGQSIIGDKLIYEY